MRPQSIHQRAKVICCDTAWGNDGGSRCRLPALGLALPTKRITVNLSPTDLVKEGNHFDLPIALGVLASLGVIPSEVANGYFVFGELSLDGALNRVSGVLPVAAHAASLGYGIVCPEVNGGEAAWGGFQEIDVTSEDDEAAGRRELRRNDIVAAPSLLALINHLRGVQRLPEPPAKIAEDIGSYPDLSDVKGQETAKRALEVAAAGGHFEGTLGMIIDGTEEQRQKYLPKIAAGQIIASFCLTEPDAGSDVASLTTRATADGEFYVINGTKHFTTNSPHAGLYTVFARTGEKGAGSKGIAAFLVERDTPGISIAPHYKKMGFRGSHTADVTFEDCSRESVTLQISDWVVVDLSP